MRRLRRALSLLFRGGVASLVVVFLLITQTPAVHWAGARLEVFAPLEKADAIVVLSGGVRFDGELSDSSLRRLVYGLRLFTRGYAPVVVLTGGNPAVPELVDSAQMERVARELGFSGESFIVETKGSRTSEQALAVARIVRARQMKSVVLVTSPIHSYRALRAFEKAGVKVIPGTTDPVLGPPPRVPWLVFSPWKISGRLRAASAVAYEYGALALYWWNGWI